MSYLPWFACVETHIYTRHSYTNLQRTNRNGNSKHTCPRLPTCLFPRLSSYHRQRQDQSIISEWIFNKSSLLRECMVVFDHSVLGASIIANSEGAPPISISKIPSISRVSSEKISILSECPSRNLRFGLKAVSESRSNPWHLPLAPWRISSE